jgi:hypothetical protein
MSLKVVPGKLEIHPEGIRFCLGEGATIVSCFVGRFVLQDLASHHLSATNHTDLQSFGELLPEIEHLANAKYVAGRTEANGEIKLGTADLLRHRVQNPGAHLEQVHREMISFGDDDIRAETMNSQLPPDDRAGRLTPKVRLHESLTALDKRRPRRRPDGALFREGLHLRTPIRAESMLSASTQDAIDLFEPVSGTVIELGGRAHTPGAQVRQAIKEAHCRAPAQARWPPP